MTNISDHNCGPNYCDCPSHIKEFSSFRASYIQGLKSKKPCFKVNPQSGKKSAYSCDPGTCTRFWKALKNVEHTEAANLKSCLSAHNTDRKNSQLLRYNDDRKSDITYETSLTQIQPQKSTEFNEQLERVINYSTLMKPQSPTDSVEQKIFRSNEEIEHVCILGDCQQLQEITTFTSGNSRNKVFYCVSPTVYMNNKSLAPQAELKSPNQMTSEGHKTQDFKNNEPKGNSIERIGSPHKLDCCKNYNIARNLNTCLHKCENISTLIGTSQLNNNLGNISNNVKTFNNVVYEEIFERHQPDQIKDSRNIYDKEIILENDKNLFDETGANAENSKDAILNCGDKNTFDMKEYPNTNQLSKNNTENEINIPNRSDKINRISSILTCCQSVASNELSISDGNLKPSNCGNDETSKNREKNEDKYEHMSSRIDTNQSDNNNLNVMPKNGEPSNNVVNQEIFNSHHSSQIINAQNTGDKEIILQNDMSKIDKTGANAKTNENTIPNCCRRKTLNKRSDFRFNEKENPNTSKPSKNNTLNEVNLPDRSNEINRISSTPSCCQSIADDEPSIFDNITPENCGMDETSKNREKNKVDSADKLVQSTLNNEETTLPTEESGKGNYSQPNIGNEVTASNSFKGVTKDHRSISDYNFTEAEDSVKDKPYKINIENEGLPSHKPEHSTRNNEENLLKCCQNNIKMLMNNLSTNLVEGHIISPECCDDGTNKKCLTDFDVATIIAGKTISQSNLLLKDCCRKTLANKTSTLNLTCYSKETFLLDWYKPYKENVGQENTKKNKISAFPEPISTIDFTPIDITSLKNQPLKENAGDKIKESNCNCKNIFKPKSLIPNTMNNVKSILPALEKTNCCTSNNVNLNGEKINTLLVSNTNKNNLAPTSPRTTNNFMIILQHESLESITKNIVEPAKELPPLQKPNSNEAAKEENLSELDVNTLPVNNLNENMLATTNNYISIQHKSLESITKNNMESVEKVPFLEKPNETSVSYEKVKTPPTNNVNENMFATTNPSNTITNECQESPIKNNEELTKKLPQLTKPNCCLSNDSHLDHEKLKTLSVNNLNENILQHESLKSITENVVDPVKEIPLLEKPNCCVANEANLDERKINTFPANNANENMFTIQLDKSNYDAANKTALKAAITQPLAIDEKLDSSLIMPKNEKIENISVNKIHKENQRQQNNGFSGNREKNNSSKSDYRKLCAEPYEEENEFISKCTKICNDNWKKNVLTFLESITTDKKALLTNLPFDKIDEKTQYSYHERENENLSVTESNLYKDCTETLLQKNSEYTDKIESIQKYTEKLVLGQSLTDETHLPLTSSIVGTDLIAKSRIDDNQLFAIVGETDANSTALLNGNSKNKTSEYKSIDTKMSKTMDELSNQAKSISIEGNKLNAKSNIDEQDHFSAEEKNVNLQALLKEKSKSKGSVDKSTDTKGSKTLDEKSNKAKCNCSEENELNTESSIGEQQYSSIVEEEDANSSAFPERKIKDKTLENKSIDMIGSKTLDKKSSKEKSKSIEENMLNSSASIEEQQYLAAVDEKDVNYPALLKEKSKSKTSVDKFADIKGSKPLDEKSSTAKCKSIEENKLYAEASIGEQQYFANSSLLPEENSNINTMEDKFIDTKGTKTLDHKSSKAKSKSVEENKLNAESSLGEQQYFPTAVEKNANSSNLTERSKSEISKDKSLDTNGGKTTMEEQQYLAVLDEKDANSSAMLKQKSKSKTSVDKFTDTKGSKPLDEKFCKAKCNGIECIKPYAEASNGEQQYFAIMEKKDSDSSALPEGKSKSKTLEDKFIDTKGSKPLDHKSSKVQNKSVEENELNAESSIGEPQNFAIAVEKNASSSDLTEEKSKSKTSEDKSIDTKENKTLDEVSSTAKRKSIEENKLNVNLSIEGQQYLGVVEEKDENSPALLNGNSKNRTSEDKSINTKISKTLDDKLSKAKSKSITENDINAKSNIDEEQLFESCEEEEDKSLALFKGTSKNKSSENKSLDTKGSKTLDEKLSKAKSKSIEEFKSNITSTIEEKQFLPVVDENEANFSALLKEKSTSKTSVDKSTDTKRSQPLGKKSSKPKCTCIENIKLYAEANIGEQQDFAILEKKDASSSALPEEKGKSKTLDDELMDIKERKTLDDKSSKAKSKSVEENKLNAESGIGEQQYFAAAIEKNVSSSDLTEGKTKSKTSEDKSINTEGSKTLDDISNKAKHKSIEENELNVNPSIEEQQYLEVVEEKDANSPALLNRNSKNETSEDKSINTKISKTLDDKLSKAKSKSITENEINVKSSIDEQQLFTSCEEGDDKSSTLFKGTSKNKTSEIKSLDTKGSKTLDEKLSKAKSKSIEEFMSNIRSTVEEKQYLPVVDEKDANSPALLKEKSTSTTSVDKSRDTKRSKPLDKKCTKPKCKCIENITLYTEARSGEKQYFTIMEKKDANSSALPKEKSKSKTLEDKFIDTNGSKTLDDKSSKARSQSVEENTLIAETSIEKQQYFGTADEKNANSLDVTEGKTKSKTSEDRSINIKESKNLDEISSNLNKLNVNPNIEEEYLAVVDDKDTNSPALLNGSSKNKTLEDKSINTNISKTLDDKLSKAKSKSIAENESNVKSSIDEQQLVASCEEEDENSSKLLKATSKNKTSEDKSLDTKESKTLDEKTSKAKSKSIQENKSNINSSIEEQQYVTIVDDKDTNSPALLNGSSKNKTSEDKSINTKVSKTLDDKLSKAKSKSIADNESNVKSSIDEQQLVASCEEEDENSSKLLKATNKNKTSEDKFLDTKENKTLDEKTSKAKSKSIQENKSNINSSIEEQQYLTVVDEKDTNSPALLKEDKSTDIKESKLLDEKSTKANCKCFEKITQYAAASIGKQQYFTIVKKEDENSSALPQEKIKSKTFEDKFIETKGSKTLDDKYSKAKSKSVEKNNLNSGSSFGKQQYFATAVEKNANSPELLKGESKNKTSEDKSIDTRGNKPLVENCCKPKRKPIEENKSNVNSGIEEQQYLAVVEEKNANSPALLNENSKNKASEDKSLDTKGSKSLDDKLSKAKNKSIAENKLNDKSNIDEQQLLVSCEEEDENSSALLKEKSKDKTSEDKSIDAKESKTLDEKSSKAKNKSIEENELNVNSTIEDEQYLAVVDKKDTNSPELLKEESKSKTSVDKSTDTKGSKPLDEKSTKAKCKCIEEIKQYAEASTGEQQYFTIIEKKDANSSALPEEKSKNKTLDDKFIDTNGNQTLDDKTSKATSIYLEENKLNVGSGIGEQQYFATAVGKNANSPALLKGQGKNKTLEDKSIDTRGSKPLVENCCKTKRKSIEENKSNVNSGIEEQQYLAIMEEQDANSQTLPKIKRKNKTSEDKSIDTKKSKNLDEISSKAKCKSVEENKLNDNPSIQEQQYLAVVEEKENSPAFLNGKRKNKTSEDKSINTQRNKFLDEKSEKSTKADNTSFEENKLNSEYSIDKQQYFTVVDEKDSNSSALLKKKSKSKTSGDKSIDRKGSQTLDDKLSKTKSKSSVENELNAKSGIDEEQLFASCEEKDANSSALLKEQSTSRTSEEKSIDIKGRNTPDDKSRKAKNMSNEKNELNIKSSNGQQLFADWEEKEDSNPSELPTKQSKNKGEKSKDVKGSKTLDDKSSKAKSISIDENGLNDKPNINEQQLFTSWEKKGENLSKPKTSEDICEERSSKSKIKTSKRKRPCCEQPERAAPKKWKTCCDKPTCPINDPTTSTYNFFLKARMCCNRKACQLAAKICDSYEPLVKLDGLPETEALGDFQYHYLGLDAETVYDALSSTVTDYLEDLKRLHETEDMVTESTDIKPPEEELIEESDLLDESKREKRTNAPEEELTEESTLLDEPKRERRTSAVSWSLPPGSVIDQGEPEPELPLSVSNSAEEAITQATAQAQKFREAPTKIKHTSIFEDIMKTRMEGESKALSNINLQENILENAPENLHENVLFKSQLDGFRPSKPSRKTNCCASLKNKFRKKKKLKVQSTDEFVFEDPTLRSSVDVERRRHTLSNPVVEKNQKINTMLNNI